MLPEAIKNIRKYNFLNQTEFANKIGVTQGAVSQWENGLTRPNSDQLQAISKAFNVSVDDLLQGEEVTKKEENGQPKTNEAKILARGVDKMPPQDREKALNILKAAYSDYFDNAEEKNA